MLKFTEPVNPDDAIDMDQISKDEEKVQTDDSDIADDADDDDDEDDLVEDTDDEEP